MQKIELVNGGVALVDDSDFEMLSEYDWYLSKDGYAYRNEYLDDYRRRPVYMHHVLIGAKKGMERDHIDNNKLNNQKSNLRLVTRSQNMQNRLKREKTRSKYIGVQPSGDKWTAQITVNRKTLYLGTYKHECVAALAYNKKAKELYGENAMVNEW